MSSQDQFQTEKEIFDKKEEAREKRKKTSREYYIQRRDENFEIQYGHICKMYGVKKEQIYIRNGEVYINTKNIDPHYDKGMKYFTIN
jgi:hypothetical protein